MYVNPALKTSSYEKIKLYMIVFRWISVIMGLWMTGFCSHKALINSPPRFLAEMPFLTVLMLFVYHIVSSYMILQYDDMKIFMGITVVSDAVVGGFMSFYFGLPYLFAAVLLPTMVATFYFDLLVAMVVGLISAIFYIMVIAVPLVRNIQKFPASAEVLTAFIFSFAAIYVGFLWSLRQEEAAQVQVKKFNDEKAHLIEDHQNAKREFGQVFNELEKKQEAVEAMEAAVQQMAEEKAELSLTLENTLRNVENLRNAMVELEAAGGGAAPVESRQDDEEFTEAQQQFIAHIKNTYESKIQGMEDDLAAMQARVAEMEEDLRNTEKQVVTNVGVNVGEVEDLRQKINILVGKINQLNIALQSREELFKSFSRIIESPGLDATYMAITGEAISLVPSQTAVLFILEESESGPLLFARAADTPYKNLFIDFTAVPGDGPVGWAAKHRQPVVIKNSDIKLKSGEELSTLLTYEKSALVTPVFFNEELTGVLYLGKPEVGAYTEKELLLINSYCRLAGPIIHTARVFSKATQVSLADETTGLFNEKYFSQRFLEEVARSRRYQIPLTLVMIEIINYARFAQSAEKAVQDRLIRDLSDVLRVHIRETDLAARLEDNRFAILFLHSQKKDTILISERIRMSAEMRSFGTPQAKQAGLKMAVGLANLPEDSQESDELYSLAQKCTDDSRIRGGNQTVFVS